MGERINGGTVRCVVPLTVEAIAVLDAHARGTGRGYFAEAALRFARRYGNSRTDPFVPDRSEVLYLSRSSASVPGAGPELDGALRHYGSGPKPLRNGVRRDGFIFDLPASLVEWQAVISFRDRKDIWDDRGGALETTLMDLDSRLESFSAQREYVADVDPKLFKAVKAKCERLGLDFDTAVAVAFAGMLRRRM